MTKVNEIKNKINIKDKKTNYYCQILCSFYMLTD